MPFGIRPSNVRVCHFTTRAWRGKLNTHRRKASCRRFALRSAGIAVELANHTETRVGRRATATTRHKEVTGKVRNLQLSWRNGTGGGAGRGMDEGRLSYPHS